MRYFWCLYTDGTTFRQPPDDLSVKDPSKSAFHDVRQDELVLFELHGLNSVYTVDMRPNQPFKINGDPILVEEQELTSSWVKDSPRRLIYCKRHLHTFAGSGQELTHTVRYVLGWQTDNLRSTIVVD